MLDRRCWRDDARSGEEHAERERVDPELEIAKVVR
jgi:hypothetical protein